MAGSPTLASIAGHPDRCGFRDDAGAGIESVEPGRWSWRFRAGQILTHSYWKNTPLHPPHPPHLPHPYPPPRREVT